MSFQKVLGLVTVLFCFCFSQQTIAQQTIYDDAVLIYKKEINGGLHVHGHGAGVFLSKSKQKTITKHNRWNIELAVVKHPKEYKNFNRYYENGKGFFFGKKNALVMLRPTYGQKNIISEKYRKQGVAISTHMAIGPAIALLKPVYIEYGYSSDPSSGTFDFLRTERFDIEKHNNINNIYGRSPFVRGISETAVDLGIYAKFGLDFEYSPYQTGVKGIETGISIDAFAEPVEIMDLQDIKNKRIFISFYLNLYFGKKYNNLDKG